MTFSVFLSYAREDHDLAEAIALALAADSNTVFFDRSSLEPGDDYRSRIRTNIAHCDLYLFLITAHSISKGAFTLSELLLVQKRWPHPKGHVLPVLVDEAVPRERIPRYLLEVNYLEQRGDLVEDVVNAVVKYRLGVLRRRRTVFVAGMILLSLGSLSMVLTMGRGSRGPAQSTPTPVYVTPQMITRCVSRGKPSVCGVTGREIDLGGTRYRQGLVYTQPDPDAGIPVANATFPVLKGARRLAFIAGNYWQGSDCGGQRPVMLTLSIDGKPLWLELADRVRSGSVEIPERAKEVTLSAQTSDGSTACDDALWANVRFEH
jgi:hypothetical protein